jgi:hypothetical protein
LRSHAPTVSQSKDPLATCELAAFGLVVADDAVPLAEAEVDEPLELAADGPVDEPSLQVVNGQVEDVSRDRSE